MENSVFKVAFVSEMLFNLCVNKSGKLLINSNIESITDNDRDWFNLKLRFVESRLRDMLSYIIIDEMSDDDSANQCSDGTICFSFAKRHRAHQKTLPTAIENAIVDILCQMWMSEHSLETNDFAKSSLDILRSIALKRDGSFYRKSNI